MYIELPTPTLVLTNIYFSFLFIRPTGKVRPAFDDLVLPEPIAALALPSLALTVLPTGFEGLGAGAPPDMLSRDFVLARAAFSFFFSLLWIGT
jgi:hypothetical protein